MAFKMMIPIAYIIVVLLASYDAEAAIGINWGRQTAQRLLPSQVVDLLLQNGITRARVYSSEDDILQAFAGSGIELTLSLFEATSFEIMEDARIWVAKKSPYLAASNLRAVYLGRYVIYEGVDKAFLNSAMMSLKNLQTALNEAGYGEQIKANFLHFPGSEMKNVSRPSEAEFLDEIKDTMTTFVRFLQENNAPFAIEMFPIKDIQFNNFDLSFAIPDHQSKQVVKDRNGAVYTNVIEFAHDSFVWALNKINASNIKIVLAQVGWPTDGYPGANTPNAERFHKSLLQWATSNRGTPMRPGQPLDIYLHSLTDENQMPYSDAFMRHWGIYRSNGEPKYKIDLSGEGLDIYPVSMRGIMRMPGRWCVYSGNTTDLKEVMHHFNDSCSRADCTCLAPGGSCSKLTFNQNVSYAFNMYFQFMFQDERACDFGGLGNVVMDDPSTDECVFPVEVVKGRQKNLVPTPGKGFHERPNSVFSTLLLSILAALFWN